MICQNCGCQLELGAKFCTHCGQETVLNNQDNVGKITITRLKKLLGCAINFTIYIDDIKLNSLSNGSTINTNVALGRHSVKVQTFEKEVTADVELTEQKKEVEVITSVKMGLLVARPSIKEIKYN